MKVLDNFTLPQVLILGAFPPPVSGNSVHIARLYSLLKEKGYRVQVLDYMGEHTPDDPPNVIRLSGDIWLKGWQVLKFMWSIPRKTIIHFHVSAFGRFKWFAPILLLATAGHKRMMTIHSGSFMVGQTKVLQEWYFRTLLSHFDALIAVSQRIKESIISLGIKPSRVSVIPAYIKQEADQRFLPKNFRDISADKVKVVTSGTLIPIYNYEILAEVIRKINEEKFHFVFAFYKNYDEQYEKGILELLDKFSNVTIYRDLSPQAFLAVLSSSDIYVRTTTRDGDSVAVREALALGKVVYATDYVWRPAGCVEFSNSHELLNHLLAWSNDQQARQPQASDETKKILKLYQSLN